MNAAGDFIAGVISGPGLDFGYFEVDGTEIRMLLGRRDPGGGYWSAGPSASTSMIEDAIIPAKTLGSDLAREIAMEIQAASQETQA